MSINFLFIIFLRSESWNKTIWAQANSRNFLPYPLIIASRQGKDTELLGLVTPVAPVEAMCAHDLMRTGW
jgi:hypothetical protein